MRTHFRPVLAALSAVAATCPVATGLAAPASAAPEHGHLIIEPGTPTGDPANALTEGFWGHEGPGHDQASVVMADLSGSNGKVTEASQAAWVDQFGTADFNSIAIAFVKASDDGSAERPEVQDGENAGQAFEWFTTSPLGSAWTGSNDDVHQDVVVPVSTLDEYQAWIEDGKPDQVPGDDYKMVNALEDNAPAAEHPLGISIQARWPAGEEISLVAFRYDGFDANGIPIVSPGKDGHAVTAWLTFKTVADPDNGAKTSAGYEVLSTSDLPDEGKGGNGGKGDGQSGDKSGKGGKGGDASGPGSDATDTALTDTSTPDPTPSATDTTEASWTNLWTGSGWAMPLLGLGVALLLVLVGGTALLRDKTNRTTR